MSKISSVLWKGKRNAKGEHPIYLRLEAGGRRQYISLRLFVRPSYWNPKSQTVRKGHRQADAYNAIIRRNVERAEDAVTELVAADKEVTPSAIKDALVARIAPRIDFLEYGRAYAEELHRRGKYPTSKRYTSILRKLQEYAGDRLPFERITLAFLRDYQGYLVETYGNKESTIAANFRAIKSIVNRAIKDRIISHDDNPFTYFPIKEPRSSKAKLSLEEIEAIRMLELEEGSPLWHARNYFMFSFYCAGIRFRDVCLLRVENVSGGRLEYSMSKTGAPKSVALVPPALKILGSYKIIDRPPTARLFPLLDTYNVSTPEKLHRAVQSRNAIINRHLKDLAEKAGIPSKLSFHLSRHSFADFARREGWDVYRISKALGHQNLKVTENYLKGFDIESMDDAMEELFR